MATLIEILLHSNKTLQSKNYLSQMKSAQEYLLQPTIQSNNSNQQI